MVKNLKFLLFFLDKKDQEKVFCEKTRRCGSVYLGSIKILTTKRGKLRFCVCSGSFEKSVRSRERA